MVRPVTIDVQNAFNTVTWSKIVTALENRNTPDYIVQVIQDYLCNRHIHIGRTYSWEVFAKVPQGSVLGPTLWNVAYDDVFISLDNPLLLVSQMILHWW